MTVSYEAILAVIVTSPDPVAAFRAYVEQEMEAGAEARRLLDDVMEVLRWSTERDAIHDPTYERLVEGLCQGVGYGALMGAAQRCWRASAQRRGDPPGGEFVAGPCRGTVDEWLRTYDAMPGAKPPKGNGAHGVIVQIDPTKEDG